MIIGTHPCRDGDQHFLKSLSPSPSSLHIPRQHGLHTQEMSPHISSRESLCSDNRLKAASMKVQNGIMPETALLVPPTVATAMPTQTECQEETEISSKTTKQKKESISTSPPPPTVPRPRKVRFNRKVLIREIPSVTEYTKTQLKTMHFTSKEYLQIRTTIVFHLKSMQSKEEGPMMQQKTLNEQDQLRKLDPNFCLFGLELEFGSMKKGRRRRQMNAMNDVLEEQERQWNCPSLSMSMGSNIDFEKIASVYKRRTKLAKQLALARALIMECEVSSTL